MAEHFADTTMRFELMEHIRRLREKRMAFTPRESAKPKPKRTKATSKSSSQT